MPNPKAEPHGRVTPYQLMTVMVGAVIGVGVLAFPRLIVREAYTAAPLATVLGAAPAALGWLVWVRLARRFPGRSPAEISTTVLTTWPGRLLIGFGALFMLVVTALTVREFGEVLKAAILPNTPIEVTDIALLLTAAYFVRYDLQVFCRVYEVFFAIVVLPLVALSLLSLQNMRLYYLFPLLGNGWTSLVRGAIVASIGYIAIIIGPFLLPNLSRKQDALRAGLWGIGISLLLYFLTVSATLAVFGPEEIKRLVWPTFELIKMTSVRGFILERMESAFIGIWVAAVFTTVGATYYVSLIALAQGLKLRDHKLLAIPLVPVLYIISLVPDDVQEFYRITELVGYVGVGLVMGTPLILMLLAHLRRKGAASRAPAG